MPDEPSRVSRSYYFIKKLLANAAYVKHARGKLDKAEKLYQKEVDTDSPVPRVYVGYASLLIAKREYARALEVAKRGMTVLRLKPDQKYVITTLGSQYVSTLWKTGRLDEAIDEAEQLHAEMPSTTTYGLLGYFYIERDVRDSGDFSKALDLNIEAVGKYDDDATILDNLGQTYYRLSDWDNAEKYFLLALAEREGQMDSLYYLARTYLQTGQRAKAEETYAKMRGRELKPLATVSEEMIRALAADLERD